MRTTAAMDDREDDDKTCYVCLERPRSIRYSPCGHAVSCDVCTLQLIEHSTNMLLKCPHCRASIEELECQPARGSSDTPIARQPTFATLGFGLAPGSAAQLVKVPAFIEAQLEMTEEADRCAMAERAKKAWVRAPSTIVPGLPDASLLLPMPPSRRLRFLALLMSLSLAVAWAWGLATVTLASREFDAYLRSGTFDVRVTQHAGFTGPLHALVHAGRECGHGLLCVDKLPNPTSHQRWWGLVPASEVGEVLHGAGLVAWARSALFFFVLLTNTGTILRPLLSCIANQPTALGELGSAGINLMVGMALLCSLYGMYWDGESEIVYINYVPGGGYVWMIAWLIVMICLFVLFLVRQQLHVLGEWRKAAAAAQSGASHASSLPLPFSASRPLPPLLSLFPSSRLSTLSNPLQPTVSPLRPSSPLRPLLALLPLASPPRIRVVLLLAFCRYGRHHHLRSLHCRRASTIFRALRRRARSALCHMCLPRLFLWPCRLHAVHRPVCAPPPPPQLERSLPAGGLCRGKAGAGGAGGGRYQQPTRPARRPLLFAIAQRGGSAREHAGRRR